MNLAVAGVSDEAAPARTPYDLSDWLVTIMAAGGFILPWTYAFLHPSEGVFGICVGATVTSGSIYHALRVHDDKRPDAK
jgi:hypothetical protein